MANTLLLDFDEADYAKPVPEVVKELAQFLSAGSHILVAHSLGTFYALQMAMLNSNLFNKLLLDLSMKNSKYLEQLQLKIAQKTV